MHFCAVTHLSSCGVFLFRDEFEFSHRPKKELQTMKHKKAKTKELSANSFTYFHHSVS